MNEEQEIEDLKTIMAALEELPFYGYRRIAKYLEKDYPHLTRKVVRRIMNRFELKAIYPKLDLSKPRKDHKKYPYLLSGKVIRHPNQVWATDVTYIRLSGGFMYLVAILDLYSRKVLSWRLSNSMDADFCIEALEEAIMLYGIPAIFNTVQGSQFTSNGLIDVLERHNIEISMDGKGRALDNIYVERLWRTLKYEDIYIKSYESVIELREGIRRYFNFYNNERFHQSLGYATPDDMYESFSEKDFQWEAA